MSPSPNTRPPVAVARAWGTAGRGLALILAAWLLAACSGLPVSLPWWPWSQNQEAEPGRPVAVRILGWTGEEAANRLLQTRIAAFEHANPTLHITGLLTPNYPAVLEDAFAAGTPPDLFQVWSHHLPDLVLAEAILSVPAELDPIQSVPPQARAAFQVAGETYCLPRDLATLALFYNPALFDRVEAPYPSPDWTWTDLSAAAAAVTDADNGLYGLVLSPDVSRLLPLLWQADTDGSPWTGSDARTAVEFYVNLFVDGVAVDPLALDAAWNGEAFGRGRAAMTLEANWLVPYLASHFPDLDYAVVDLPAGPARAASVVFGSCWAVSATAPDPQSAFALAAFLTTPETNLAWAEATGNLPPAADQATAWLAENPAYAPFVRALDHALPWSGPPGFAERVETANAVLAAAMAGDASVDGVTAQLRELLDPRLAPATTP